MRIAFDARYINSRYHGIGRYGFRLLEALAAGSQHTFVVFLGSQPDDRFDWQELLSRPNVEVMNGPRPLYWPHEQLWWPMILSRSMIDLFHSPYFVAPLFTSIPVIITVHDCIFERYPEYMPDTWTRPYYRLLMNRATRSAKKIVTPSRATADDVEIYYSSTTDKIRVVSPGIDPGFSRVTDKDNLARIRSKYGLERPIILSVGARRPHKNLTRLIEAFNLIAPEVPHNLVLAGPADARFPDEAQKVVAEKHLNGRVQEIGWVDEADLAGLYSLADLYALPSIVEGFGLTALESMACGTPVLAGNSSATPEVVGDGGLLVDIKDVTVVAQAMAKILKDEECRKQLSQSAFKQAGGFGWLRSAGEMMQLYQEVVN
jgi:glycosyltransferase involved in cell wall biosynthesis